MTNPAHAPSIEDLLEHREWLRAIARGLVADENVVDDVEQRTWLTVLRNRRPVTSARGWLRHVVHSAAVDEHRSESRRHAREEQSARAEALPSTDHLVVQLEAQRTVAKAVMGLPEPYRTTVLLRYIEELSVKDVAARMSVPVKTVKTRLHRALALLRDALDREYGDRRGWCLALLPLIKTRFPITVGTATAGATVMTAKTKVAAAVTIALLLFAIGAAIVFKTDARGPLVDEVARALSKSGVHSPHRRIRELADSHVSASPNDGPGFAFPKSAFVGVRVIDAAGRPARGATVRLMSRTLQSTPAVVATRVADEDGVVRFDGLVAHAGGIFEADARSGSGFAATTATEVGSVTVLALVSAKIVHVVVTRGGAPASAHVSIGRWDDRGFFDLIDEREVGPDGRDAVLLPVEGRFRFTAVRPDGASESVEVRGDTSSEVALVVPTGERRIRVETDVNRRPVADVEVWLSGVVISTQPTDAAGRTEVGELPAGRLSELSIRRGGIGVSTPRSVVQADDGSTVLRIDEQAAQGRLSIVRVVAPDGRPVEGVSVGWTDRVGVAGLGQTLTDPSGETYGIAWSGRVIVAARGFRIAWADVSPGANELRLEPALSRKVRVVDDRGAPVPNAWISFARGAVQDRAYVVLHADGDGVAEFVDEAGWNVSVRAPEGYRPTDAAALATGDVDVVWRPHPDVPLGGTLSLPPGSSAERFVITLLSGPRVERYDASTRFSLTGKWASFVWFTVESADGKLEGEYRGAPSTSLSIAMRPKTVLRIAPELPDGSQPHAAGCRVVGARDGGDVHELTAVVDADGGWSVGLDGPGAWDLLVQVGDQCGVVRTKGPPAHAGGAPIAVKLVHAGAIALRVDVAPATSDAVARLAITPSGGSLVNVPFVLTRRDVVVDELGRFVVAGLVPGRYDAVVSFGKSAEGAQIAAAADIEVRSGATTEIRPEVRVLRRIELVADASGERRSGMRVVPVDAMKWTRALWRSQVLEQDGREFAFAWDGDFALEDESGTQRFRVTVAPGATSVTPAPR